MAQPLDGAALEQLFDTARTNSRWQPREVPDALLRQIIDHMKWAPTSANCSPAGFVSPRLYPPTDDKGCFAGKKHAVTTAFRNGSLQRGYFILAARALGLDCGPAPGFNNDGVDAEFFAGTEIKSNFLCNLGYGDSAGIYPRSPRFSFDEMASIV